MLIVESILNQSIELMQIQVAQYQNHQRTKTELCFGPLQARNCGPAKQSVHIPLLNICT